MAYLGFPKHTAFITLCLTVKTLGTLMVICHWRTSFDWPCEEGDVINSFKYVSMCLSVVAEHIESNVRICVWPSWTHDLHVWTLCPYWVPWVLQPHIISTVSLQILRDTWLLTVLCMLLIIQKYSSYMVIYILPLNSGIKFTVAFKVLHTARIRIIHSLI